MGDAQAGSAQREWIPDTLKFVDEAHAGHRMLGKRAAVFGGSSGIGFATAAYAVQECASHVALVARNHVQLKLAADVLKGLNRAHCPGAGVVVDYVVADVSSLAQVQAAFAALREAFGGAAADLVLNTAGHAGYIGKGLAEVPESIFQSKFDAVANNLYGAMFVTREAVRAWNVTEEGPAAGASVPVLVHLSSEEGLTGCPGCAMYGMSKSGIISLTRSAAAMYEGALRAYAIAPGLTDTPLSWNQIRGTRLAPDGSLEQVDDLEPYQCYDADGGIIEDGSCSWGGTGAACPCPDEAADDPRLPAKFGPAGVWPPIDPRELAELVLRLTVPEDAPGESGHTFVVVNKDARRAPSAAPEVVRWIRHETRDCTTSSLDGCALLNPGAATRSDWGPLHLLHAAVIAVLVLALAVQQRRLWRLERSPRRQEPLLDSEKAALR